MSTSPTIEASKILPFLKWAGGKRWLADSYTHALPQAFTGYCEPFLGSGAIFFSIRPDNAVLSDINEELIECYSALRDDWRSVERHLARHQKHHCKDHYYRVRSSLPRTVSARAARFIYLNRTCWNGLYRVNLRGEFNVPIGTKHNVLLDTDQFELLANLLKSTTLAVSDFETVIDQAKAGTLVFADPPYTVRHNLNGFVKYNEKIFHWDDQIRLCDCLVRASNRGCLICLTNANHPSIEALYKDDFDLTVLSRNSVIAASSRNRGKYEELLITNY